MPNLPDEHTFVLGTDRHGQEHTITVGLALSADGCTGLEINSNRSGLRLLPINTRTVHVSTLDPRDIKPEK